MSRRDSAHPFHFICAFGVPFVEITGAASNEIAPCKLRFEKLISTEANSDYIFTILLTVVAVLIVNLVPIVVLAVLDHQFVF